MDTTVDLLKIKIEKARNILSEESRNAIDAIDWKTIILGMRAEKGYSYTQLENLETETELLLCGLINPEEYPRELEKRMGLPSAKVDELVNEMNEKVFKKIREELIKNIERKKGLEKDSGMSKDTFNNNDDKPLETREELLKHIENPDLLKQKELPVGDKEELKGEPLKNSPRVPLEESHPILAQKLSGSFQIPTVETEHSLSNITKTTEEEKTKPKIDPYREIPQ